MEQQETEELIEYSKPSRTRLKKHVVKEIVVEVMPKARQGKCVGAPQLKKPMKKRLAAMKASSVVEEEESSSYNIIHDDIWNHISLYIRPEDVQSFALICRQTAAIVASRRFWRTLYQKYCSKCSMDFYEEVRIRNAQSIESSGDQALRHLVIRSLVICVDPWWLLKREYPLEWLLGHTFIKEYHVKCGSLWLICFKFNNNYCLKKAHNQQNNTTESANLQPVDNWEELLNADEDAQQIQSISAASKFSNPNEGDTILMIVCADFAPSYNNLLYAQNDIYARWRFDGYNERLLPNLTDKELQLRFCKSSYDIITVELPGFKNYKVIPWWSPHFISMNEEILLK